MLDLALPRRARLPVFGETGPFSLNSRPMPRRLKIYVTTSGFFDLAVAAPSKKAALEIWGAGRNLFDQGYARETDDADIVKAALAKPGVVLRRGVGARGAFKEKAELPDFSVFGEAAKARAPAPRKPAPAPEADEKTARLYQQASERREREQARALAAERKRRERRDRAVAKAQAALAAAQAAHDERAASLDAERARVDRAAQAEEARWGKERQRLQAALRRARS